MQLHMCCTIFLNTILYNYLEPELKPSQTDPPSMPHNTRKSYNRCSKGKGCFMRSCRQGYVIVLLYMYLTSDTQSI